MDTQFETETPRFYLIIFICLLALADRPLFPFVFPPLPSQLFDPFSVHKGVSQTRRGRDLANLNIPSLEKGM